MAPFREHRFTSQDGITLYFREYGPLRVHRTPVLCLGGLTRNSKDFHGLASWLATEHERRVICPDYRGRGRSGYDPDWRRYHPATYLGDLRQLLTVAGVHRALVVGTSMGGVMVMAMGVYMPTVVVGAVLNDIGPEIADGGLEPVINYMQDDRPVPSWEAAVEHLRHSCPDFPAQTDDDWMTIARATYREAADGMLRFDWDPAIVKPMLEGMGENIDLWPFFHALNRVPVLALRGAKSHILTEAGFKRMTKARPGIDSLTVGGVGHAPGLGEPEVRAALETFLRRVP